MEITSNGSPKRSIENGTEPNEQHVSARTRSRSSSVGTRVGQGPFKRSRVLKFVNTSGEENMSDERPRTSGNKSQSDVVEGVKMTSLERNASVPARNPRGRAIPSYIQANADVFAYCIQGKYWEEAFIADVHARDRMCTIIWKESNITEVIPINLVSPCCAELEHQMMRDRDHREKSRASQQQVVQDSLPAETTVNQREISSVSDQKKTDLTKEGKHTSEPVRHSDIPYFVNIGMNILAYNSVDNIWEPALITKLMLQDETCEIMREGSEASELISIGFVRELSKTLVKTGKRPTTADVLPEPRQTTQSVGKHCFLAGAVPIYELHKREDVSYVLMPLVQRMEKCDVLKIMVCRIKSPSDVDIAKLAKCNVVLSDKEGNISVEMIRRTQGYEYTYVNWEDQMNEPVPVYVLFSMEVDMQEGAFIVFDPGHALIPGLEADDLVTAISHLRGVLNLDQAFQKSDLFLTNAEGTLLNEATVQRVETVLVTIAMVLEREDFPDEENLTHAAEEAATEELNDEEVRKMLMHTRAQLCELEQRLETVTEHQEEQLRKLEEEYANKYNAVTRRVTVLEKEVGALRSVLSKTDAREQLSRAADAEVMEAVRSV